jgi:PhoPQ-activated pathogenicity-related protein
VAAAIMIALSDGTGPWAEKGSSVCLSGGGHAIESGQRFFYGFFLNKGAFQMNYPTFSKRVWLFVLALAILAATPALASLKDYVTRPDDSYRFELVETRDMPPNTVEVIRMTSQTWQGIVWTHWLTVVIPPEVAHPENVLLVIGGGSTRDTAPRFGSEESRIIGMVASQTKSVVAGLMQVPNQPLFDGRNEDEIIALTYARYLNGDGEDWPLLKPMAKSAVKAMDTIQTFLKDKYQQEVNGFVLTGGSKRGWTSWLAAASGDPRVKAIAPVVIDVLNMSEQMPRQLASYGAYSNQIQDYTDLQIQEHMDTPRGQKLLQMVDPYAYRDSTLAMPKLVMLGTNDPYWTVDAANLYFPELKAPKHLYYMANTGHGINIDGVSTMTQFYYDLLQGRPFTGIEWNIKQPGHLEVTWEKAGGEAFLWQAFSPNRDFRNATWNSTRLEGGNKASVNIEAPEAGWTACYVEVKWPGDFGFQFGNCTQMTVLPDTFPFPEKP